MKVLFDTNVLLDALLAREPFVTDAAFLLEAVELGRREAGRQGREEQKFFPIITRQNKFDELLATHYEFSSVEIKELARRISR